MTALPLLVLLAASPADPSSAPATVAGTWVVAEGSTVSYHLVHKFHAVDGIAHAVEARARVSPDGALAVAIRARVDAFDSGNSNRDAHMQEVTETARFPFVTVKGVAEGIRIDAYPATIDVPLRGSLDFHGVSRELEVKARVTFPSPGRAEVEATFPVSLTAHGVERPSLLFVKVDDRLDVTARLAFERAAP